MDRSTRYLDELARRPPLPQARERGLVARARHGDAGARAELVEAFLPQIVAMSRRFGEAGVEAVELIQEGVVGLLRALEPGGPAEAGYEELAGTADSAELRGLLVALSEREEVVLGALRGRPGKPSSHEEVAVRLGLAPEQVRRIERRARAKLAAAGGTDGP
jgi:DNA-directed RNA polymerase sigma subunit (sigma70/sigma32)